MMAHNDALCSRILQDTFRGSKNQVELHPADFDLYDICNYNEENGKTDGEPRFVCNMTVVLPPSPNGGDHA